jgi:NHL repeat
MALSRCQEIGLWLPQSREKFENRPLEPTILSNPFSEKVLVRTKHFLCVAGGLLQINSKMFLSRCIKSHIKIGFTVLRQNQDSFMMKGYPINQSFGVFLKNFCVWLGLVFFSSRLFNRLHRNSMGVTLAGLLTLLTSNLSPSAYGQAAHCSGAQSTVASSGLNLPIGVAVDGSGNIYTADTVNNRVLKETPSNGGYIESTVVSSLPNSPWAVAADGSGNVYISIPDSNQVLIETLAGGAYTQSTVGSGMNGPHGVGVDSRGNIYTPTPGITGC